MKRLLLLAPLLIILTLAGCSSAKPTVSDAWVRATVLPSQSSTAAYMTINGDDTLTSVSVAPTVADSAELHQAADTGDMMSMRPTEKIAIKGTLTLRPGADHIMINGLKKPIVAGDKVAITLEFAKSGSVVVNAIARES